MSFKSMVFKKLFQRPWTEIYPKIKRPAPEGFRGKIVIDDNLCRACGTCVRVCPSNAIELYPEENMFILKIYHEKCIRCGECISKCPFSAIKFVEEYEFISTHQSSLMSMAKIPALKCVACGKLFVSKVEVSDILGKLGKNYEYLSLMCEDCRRQMVAQKIAFKK